MTTLHQKATTAAARLWGKTQYMPGRAYTEAATPRFCHRLRLNPGDTIPISSWPLVCDRVSGVSVRAPTEGRRLAPPPCGACAAETLLTGRPHSRRHWRASPGDLDASPRSPRGLSDFVGAIDLTRGLRAGPAATHEFYLKRKSSLKLYSQGIRGSISSRASRSGRPSNCGRRCSRSGAL